MSAHARLVRNCSIVSIAAAVSPLCSAQPHLDWDDAYTGPLGEGASGAAMVADSPRQAVYIAGTTVGALPNGGSTSDFLLTRYDAATGARMWERTLRFGFFPEVSDVAVDGAGNVVLVGSGDQGIPLGYDWVVAKFTQAGDLLWTRSFHGGDPDAWDDYADAVVIDEDGDIYVGGAAAHHTFQGGDSAATLIKYSAAGETLWSRVQDESDGIDRWGHLVIGPAGIHAGGSIGDGFGFSDMFVRTFSPEGDTVWTQTFSGPGGQGESVQALRIDSTGAVVAAGTTSGGVATYYDVAVVKWSAAGAPQWSQVFTGPGGQNSEFMHDMTVDAADHIVVCGALDGPNNTDALLMRYSPEGTLLWAVDYLLPRGELEVFNRVATDTAGGIYTTGLFYPSDPAILAAKHSPAGALEWVMGYTVPTGGIFINHYGTDIAVDASRNVYITGYGRTSQVTVKYSQSFADFSGDGEVGAADLAMLLGAWGQADAALDLDGDGIVGAGDLAIVLGAWS